MAIQLSAMEVCCSSPTGKYDAHVDWCNEAVSWTMRELRNAELDSVSGCRGGTETVATNETITIDCNRKE